MIRTTAISAFAALAITACQQADSTTAAVDTESSPGAPTPAPPRDGVPPPQVTPSASPATAKAIPERFRGVWDNAGGSCDPASDLRMEIGAVSIEFYESLGTVTGVTVESPDRIVVDLAMEGEGERWEVQNRYELINDGTTLTQPGASDSGRLAITRKRCPA